jgi:hypothetical protein
MERESRSEHVFETGVLVSHELCRAAQKYVSKEALQLRVKRVESSGALRVYLPTSEGIANLPVPPEECAVELQRRLAKYRCVYNDPGSFTSIGAFTQV